MQPSKYQRWYDAIVESARDRDIPRAYTEVHHIKPRSFGGGNEPSNLVRLTYREHFLAHWLLTKVCSGGDLRRMQRALFAMTLCANGTRITAGWQFEIAKRAIRDLELDPVAEAAWQDRNRARVLADREALRRRNDEFVRRTQPQRRQEHQLLVSSIASDGLLSRASIAAATKLLLGNPYRKLGKEHYSSKAEYEVARARSISRRRSDSSLSHCEMSPEPYPVMRPNADIVESQ